MTGTKDRERIVVDKAYQLDYTILRDIVRSSAGWIRSSGGEDGETAEVWYCDKCYVFTGRGLVDFLYAVKDVNTDVLYSVKDFIDYVEKSAKQPPSVFVRDAIVGQARALKQKMEGADAS